MGRNIVVCCDGTSNQFSRANTNVVKLYQRLVQDGRIQATYYHPGLGTLEAVGALTSVGRKLTKLLGLAVGYGLEDDVLRAYSFIASSWKPGDHLFLFGFSRGAYTVRAVASLLHVLGILRPGHDDLAKFALRMLSAKDKVRPEDGGAGIDFELLADLGRTFSVERCPVHFVGVWDTVSSVGWLSNPLSLPHTADNPSISIGRHAVSIDERRAFFRTNLWFPTPTGGPKDVLQVWFPGDHCDVGGGHSDGRTTASDVALAWMLREASDAGLLLTDASTDAATAAASLHESLKGWWVLAEFVPKRRYDRRTKTRGWRLNLFRRRSMPEEAAVHESAFKLGRPYVDRLPQGAHPVL